MQCFKKTKEREEKMKKTKKIVSLACLMVLLLSCMMAFSSCGVNGSYYFYDGNEKDESYYIDLDKEEWTATGSYFPAEVGRLEVEESKVTLFAIIDGKEVKISEGTVEDGVLK